MSEWCEQVEVGRKSQKWNGNGATPCPVISGVGPGQGPTMDLEFRGRAEGARGHCHSAHSLFHPSSLNSLSTHPSIHPSIHKLYSCIRLAGRGQKLPEFGFGMRKDRIAERTRK